MLISDKYKFIFIHIPKTGGSSVREALKEVGVTRSKPTRFQRLLGQVGLNKNYQTYRFRMHGNLQSVEEIMPRELFQQYTKFSVVRNPWDRLVSEYEYFRQGSEVHKIVLKRRRHSWARGINTFDDFVKAKAERIDATQYYYLKNLNEKLGVDLVLKQELLNENFDNLCTQLGLDCRLQRYNTTKRRNSTATYFNNQLNDFVKKHWKKDIELFDYQQPVAEN